MRNTTIVPAREKHLDGIERIEKQCFSLPWTRENLAAYLPDEMHTMLVAERDDGSVSGYVGLMSVLDEGYISNVAVAEECRRQGVGDALITALLNIARERELSFVTLEVRASNAPAIALYEKHGFSAVGLRKNYYEKPRENAILMTNFLEPREEA